MTDNGAPARVFRLDQAVEVFHSRRVDIAPDIGKLFDDLRVLHCGSELLMDLLGNGRRQLRRRHHANPGRELGGRNAGFGHRRHVGQQGRALGAGDGERTNLAGLHMGGHRGEVADHHLDLAANQVHLRCRNALVGHVGDLDARARAEKLRRHMQG